MGLNYLLEPGWVISAFHCRGFSKRVTDVFLVRPKFKKRLKSLTRISL